MPRRRYGTRWISNRLVPTPCAGSPAVIATRSPGLGDRPAHGRAVAQSSSSLRMLVQSSACVELIPKSRFIRRTVSSLGETASTGTRGRWAEISRAVRPEDVGHDDRLQTEPVAGGDGDLGDRLGDVVLVLLDPGEDQLAVRRWGSVDAGDPVHHPHGLDRVVADRRLLGEHHGVGAVVDRVGDVGHLGAGRARGPHHRRQHLGRGDRRLRGAAGERDQPLLRSRHLLDRQLDARGRRGRP